MQTLFPHTEMISEQHHALNQAGCTSHRCCAQSPLSPGTPSGSDATWWSRNPRWRRTSTSAWRIHGNWPSWPRFWTQTCAGAVSARQGRWCAIQCMEPCPLVSPSCRARHQDVACTWSAAGWNASTSQHGAHCTRWLFLPSISLRRTSCISREYSSQTDLAQGAWAWARKSSRRLGLPPACPQVHLPLHQAPLHWNLEVCRALDWKGPRQHPLQQCCSTRHSPTWAQNHGMPQPRTCNLPTW